MDMLMNEMWVRLGWTSLQSAVLVGVLWGVCKLLPALPAATRVRLWWLVAAQALVGLVWNSPLELAVLPAAPVQAFPLGAVAATDVALAAAPTALEAAVMTAPAAALWSWPALLLAAWMTGIAVMAWGSLRGYRASRALVRGAADCTDASLQQALQLAAEAHGLRRAPPLKISAQIRSPQLIGPWNPVLLLPAREMPAMAADDLDMALTHELIHLQRRDLWWGLVPALAQHLFFFHPLVHLAAREYALAREEACDGAVVAGHGHCRHEYGRLLVQLGVAPRPAAGVASASPNFRSLKRRLLTLQQTRRFPRVASMAITAVFVLVGVAPLRLVAADVPAPPVPPPAPTAPVAPPPPRAPTAPAAVTAPLPAKAPRALPPPPSPPVAPAPPQDVAHGTTLVTHGTLTLSKGPEQAFVLMGDGDNFVDASMDDLKQAQRHASGNQHVLWVRQGNSRYLIRDPQLLSRIGDAYQAVGRLGNAQGTLGDRQAAIGERIAELSIQGSQDALASMDRDVAVMANEAARGAAQGAASDAQQAAQAKATAVMARYQASVAREQAELGREQARLARQQAVASARAAREVRLTISQAIADGKAQRLRD